MAVERLDKLISKILNISRNDAKLLIKKGNVKIDGEIIKKSDIKCDTEKNQIFVNDTACFYKQYRYIMMHKPSGVVCSTDDSDVNVIDILPDDLKCSGLFPVGRLDKDTTGLLIITNDGVFAHKVISPNKNLIKRYLADLAEPLDDDAINTLTSPMTLADGTVVKPAQIKVLSDDKMQIEIGIGEGKYHQVKRMLGAVNNRVVSLHRQSIGSLSLDSSLSVGECRELTQSELDELLQNSDI